MKAKKYYIMGGAFFLLFIIWIVLIKTVDVAAIGPEGSQVGFSTINGAFAEKIGIHMIPYYMTEALGVLAILVAAFFALLGLLQLSKVKKIKRVDRGILCLGGLYVAVVLIYAIFEKLIINYRPVILDESEGLEASFPSSHTMLAFVIFGSAVIVLPRYIKKLEILRELQALGIIFLLLTVFGRLFSGVHWFTDIVGGVLISLALLSAFIGALKDE